MTRTEITETDTKEIGKKAIDFPKEAKKRIIKNGTDKNLTKIFTTKWLQIEYSTKKENTGLLSIINGLHALKIIDRDFIYPDGFPKTVQEARKLLEEDEKLRKTILYTYPKEIAKDNCPLDADIIYNLMKRLTEKTSKIQVLWDTLNSNNVLYNEKAYPIFDDSDWVIIHKGILKKQYYKSYTRINQDKRLCIDGLENPYEISDVQFKEKTDLNRIRFTAIKYNKPDTIQ